MTAFLDCVLSVFLQVLAWALAFVLVASALVRLSGYIG